MKEGKKMGRLIHISENKPEGKRYYTIEDEQHDIYRLCVDINTQQDILEDMEDISIGDIVKFFNGENGRARAQLAAAHRKPLSAKHTLYMNTIRNAEDHISNGMKDQALTEATQWLMRYMGIVREASV